VYASPRRDREAARRFFQRASTATGVAPVEVVTDRAPTYPAVVDELSPAWHHVERYANNRVEADHAQLKRRLRPMRGIKTMTGLRVVAAGFVRPRSPRKAGQVGTLNALFFALTSAADTWSTEELARWQRDAGLQPRKPIRLRTAPDTAIQASVKPS
jgi:DDE domain